MVDPGPDDPAHIDAILSALRPGERITDLLVTHTHADHSSASRALRAITGAWTYGFGPQLRLTDPDTTRVVFGDPELDPDPATPRRPTGGDRSFRADVRVGDGDVVEGESWSLEAVHTPGHASNHLCYLVREEGMLCSGDHIMGWATTAVPPPDGKIGEYLASLEKLLGRSQDLRYLPAHGPPISNPHRLVRAFIAHRRKRNEQILRLLESGPATIGEVVPRLYADTRKEVWRGAGASVYAHLLHLEEIGIVEAEDGAQIRRASRVRLRR